LPNFFVCCTFHSTTSSTSTTTITTTMATAWDRISVDFRAYLEEAGHNADEFNKLTFIERTEALNLFKENQRKQADSTGRKRRMEDLLAYHRAVVETGTSKSSKLFKVRHTINNSKLCFLCGTAGTDTNRIEASHIVQKQDIYATGGEDAIQTFDIVRGWTSGRGWIRPFRMHDPMNLIWLCHTHNLAFDSHQFGITLTGLDNSVGFCSYSREYDDLVAAANSRLVDATDRFFDLSYVSKRAVGMRLFKAQESGHYLNHDNTSAWETVVRLSAAASVDRESSDSEDKTKSSS
jgi:hypothetical protein